jgi:hypothetical protein
VKDDFRRTTEAKVREVLDIEDPSKEDIEKAVRRLSFLDLSSRHDQAVKLQSQNLGQRAWYARALLILLCAQAIAINVFFVLVGCHRLAISDDVFKTFAVSVFAEIVALPLIVTRSLFPSKNKSTTDILLDFMSERFTGAKDPANSLP